MDASQGAYWPYPAPSTFYAGYGYGLHAGAPPPPEPTVRDIMAYSEVVHGKVSPWQTEAREQFTYVSPHGATPVAYAAPPPPPHHAHGYGAPADSARASSADYAGHAAAYGQPAPQSPDGGRRQPPQPQPPPPAQPPWWHAGEAAAAPHAGTTRANPSAGQQATDAAGGDEAADPTSARAASAAKQRARSAAALRAQASLAVTNADRPPWRPAGNTDKKYGARGREGATTPPRTPRASSAARARPTSAAAAGADKQAQPAAKDAHPPHPPSSRVGVTHHLAGPHPAHAGLPQYNPAAYGGGGAPALPPQPQPQPHFGSAGQSAYGGGGGAPAAPQHLVMAGHTVPYGLGYGAWPPGAHAAASGAVALQFHAFQPAQTRQLDPRSYRGLPASAMLPIPAAGVRSRRGDNLSQSC
jgi:hypothetical protein